MQMHVTLEKASNSLGLSQLQKFDALKYFQLTRGNEFLKI